MAEKKVVRYKLVKHKWPDEIKAERDRRMKKVAVVVICILCFCSGFFLNQFTGTKAVVNDNENTKKFAEIYTLMKNQFYFGKDQKKLEETLISGAIEGMVDAGGDIHTSYLDPKSTQSFTSSMEGSYVGIGIQFYSVDENTFIVSKVFQDSPAESAGIMAGDQIYAVAGTVCKDMDSDKVKSLISGSKEKKIEVEVIRENKHLKKNVKLATVLSTVSSEIRDTTGILELSTFAETSGTEVENHLKSMKEKGVTSLVLDLRDNTGGYLVAAQQIASNLLPADTVIFKEQSKDGKIQLYKTIDDRKQYTFDKIVVVVNGDTASAAEVLTAALKEQLNAKVVGVKTYGKGTVQTPLAFPDGSMFKYTIAEWLTPKGEHINEKGITPDVIVEQEPALTIGAPELKKDEVYKADTVNVAAKSVQLYLKFLGYPADRSDNYFSPASSEALKQYQKDKGLPVTGEINQEVLSSLLSSCAVKWHSNTEEYDYQMKKAVSMANGK